MKYSLAIFDFDGTIGDTTPIIMKTFRLTFERLNISYPGDSVCRSTIGFPLRESFMYLLPSFSEDKIQHCVNTYRTVFYEIKPDFTSSLFPGVKETLQLFHSQGLTLTVASSRTGDSLKNFLIETGIKDLFSLILGAESVSRPKPDSMAVNITLEKLDIKPGNTIVVGDMPVDILMGNGAGCDTAGVTYGNSDRKRLEEAGANYIVDRFSDLKNIILQNN